MTSSQKVDLPLPGAPTSNTTMGFPSPSPSVLQQYNSIIKMDHIDDSRKTLKSENPRRKKDLYKWVRIPFYPFSGVVEELCNSEAATGFTTVCQKCSSTSFRLPVNVCIVSVWLRVYSCLVIEYHWTADSSIPILSPRVWLVWQLG